MPQNIESKVIADPTGLNAAASQATIEAQGFTVSTSTALSDSVAVDLVISYDVTPTANSHHVHLVVSLGAPPPPDPVFGNIICRRRRFTAAYR